MPTYSPHVMVELTARVPRGQQGYWDIIRGLHQSQGEWTVGDIDARSNVARRTISHFVRALAKGGYVEVVREIPPVLRGGGAERVYRLVRNQPDAPKLRPDGSPAKDIGRGQDQMWRAMKMADKFTSRELAVLASTAEFPVPATSAAAYIRHLLAAGYLKQAPRGVYRLRPDRNTGPLAPQVYRSDWVFDQNLKQGFGPTGGVGVAGGAS